MAHDWNGTDRSSGMSSQRWGILPTRAFWSRRGAGQSVKVFVVTFWMLTASLGARVATLVDWWIAPLVAAGTFAAMFLGQGVLERYLRKRAAFGGERNTFPTTNLAGHADDDDTPPGRLAVGFLLVLAVFGLISWQTMSGDRARQERRELRMKQLDQAREVMKPRPVEAHPGPLPLMEPQTGTRP